MFVAMALRWRDKELARGFAAGSSHRYSAIRDSSVARTSVPRATGWDADQRARCPDLPWATDRSRSSPRGRHRIVVCRRTAERIDVSDKRGCLPNLPVGRPRLMAECRRSRQHCRTAADNAAFHFDSFARPRQFADSLRWHSAALVPAVHNAAAKMRHRATDSQQTSVAELVVASSAGSSAGPS